MYKDHLHEQEPAWHTHTHTHTHIALRSWPAGLHGTRHNSTAPPEIHFLIGSPEGAWACQKVERASPRALGLFRHKSPLVSPEERTVLRGPRPPAQARRHNGNVCSSLSGSEGLHAVSYTVKCVCIYLYNRLVALMHLGVMSIATWMGNRN